jgi:CubicO group peptidase (beta-lactamase class C family)
LKAAIKQLKTARFFRRQAMNPLRKSRNAVRRANRRQNRVSRRRRVGERGFETLEDRRLMAVDLAQSTFSDWVMGDNIEQMSNAAAVGYGYAINVNGVTLSEVGGGGQARTAADGELSFTSMTELEVSSVSKPITATAILHMLQSKPAGLDAMLNTPLNAYLPSDWVPGPNTQFITLRHLLTHNSGLSESNNLIGVEFESYNQNTFANLKNLIETGIAPPNRSANDIFNGPWWDLGGSVANYNNANFTLLARVVLPKLINPAVDLTAANYADRDVSSGAMYKQYVQDNIFEPMGIMGADMKTNVAPAALGYSLATADNATGMPQSDLTKFGGAFGWKLTSRELATFLDGIKRDNAILSPATRQMRDDQELGWNQSADTFGEYFSHGGSTGGSGNFRSEIISLPGNIEASYLMNSESSNLPGNSTRDMLKTAYVNGWTDLTEVGTSGNDDYVLRLNNSGVEPSIEVVLNGQVQFAHWISTLDSLTVNGGFGNDTFTIEGWSPAIDLTINGGSGNDEVFVLPGARNIEAVNGMTFNGGSGEDSITVNDNNNPYSNAVMSRMYTVTNGSVARFRQNPGMPGNPAFFLPVVVNYSSAENMQLTTGGQNDVVQLVSKTAGDANILTGNGDDMIVVAQTAGNLEAVDGLWVDGQSGSDTIRLYDHNETSGDPDAVAYYDTDANSVERYVASLGGIGIGEPSPVGVGFAHTENLELTTTDMVDAIRVHATTTGETIVHAGAGNDLLVAAANGKNLELVDDLSFFGEAGLDTITLNDQDNPYSHPGLSRLYNVSASGVNRMAAIPSNQVLIPIPIGVAYNSVENLNLTTGDQSDVVNVESAPYSSATIHTGLGNDVVSTSPSGMNFETVDGLVVDGGLGVDTLNIHDENNPYELGAGGSTFTVTPDSVGRYAEHVLYDNVAVPVGLEFAAMENVLLATGAQSDVFNVSGVGGTGALTLDGNSGADRFNIASPAFASINVQGDSPIFFPGDQLSVNEDALYVTSDIPGLYVAGSGGVMIGDTSVYYSGIETSDVQPQIYGGPGDFDLNGLVNGEDLTHPTLGWKVRFGDDLDGNDLLVWQRYLGTNRLPRGGMSIAVGDIAGDAARMGGGGSDLADWQSNYGVGLAAASQQSDSAGDVDGRDFLIWQRGASPSQATLQALDAAFASATRKVPTLLVSAQPLVGGDSGDEGFDVESNETAWDGAFEKLGAAVLAAV